MSKNTKIILGVIAVLALIIIAQRTVKFSNVPSLKKWDVSADEISIKNKTAAEFKIVKKDGKWFVGDKSFPADNQMIANLEKKMNDLSFSEKVTSKQFYERFDLTADSAIRVIVKHGGKTVRDILLGKKSTGEQSYVKFPDKPEVYLAPGGLTGDFDKTVDSLRDKVLLSATQDAIESFSIKGKFTVEKKIEKPVEQKEAKASPSNPVPAAVKWIMKENGKEADAGRLNELLGDLVSMRAFSYPDENSIKAAIASGIQCEIVVKANGKETTLSIYGKEKNDKAAKYVCRSSENSFYALIEPWIADRFIRAKNDEIVKK
jgi:hypothetical protein